MFVPAKSIVVAGRYELIEEIGRGGMGVVWRCRHVDLDVDCAIKFIHTADAQDPKHRRRFVREARAAASLKSPNSVAVFDVGEWQGTLFIAMELLSGESLEASLVRDGKLAPALVVEIIEQVARALHQAHAAHLVHCDLKPENIFIVDTEPLQVKILDFGIAQQRTTASGLQTTSGALVGTPWYMSPEQADGGKIIDFRSDLWSLAVVAYRCLTGRFPFAGDALGQVLMRIMQGSIVPLSEQNPSLPQGADTWWFSVMQREPELRPESALALASGLRRALLSDARGSHLLESVAGERESVVSAAQPILPPVRPMRARARTSWLDPTRLWLAVAVISAPILLTWFWRSAGTASSEPCSNAAAAPARAQTLDLRPVVPRQLMIRRGRAPEVAAELAAR